MTQKKITNSMDTLLAFCTPQKTLPMHMQFSLHIFIHTCIISKNATLRSLINITNVCVLQNKWQKCFQHYRNAEFSGLWNILSKVKWESSKGRECISGSLQGIKFLGQTFLVSSLFGCYRLHSLHLIDQRLAPPKSSESSR